MSVPASIDPLHPRDDDRGAVHLHFARTPARSARDCLELVRASLSPEEITRGERIHRELAARSFFCAHAMARGVLARELDVPPQALEFETDAFGKPRIVATAQRRAVEFSLTHADGIVACIVARGRRVGVDAEPVVSSAVLEEILDHALSSSERAELAPLDPHSRATRLLETWTIKEAYAKALGRGLSIAFHRIDVVFEPAHAIAVQTSGDIDPDPTAWHFATWRPTREHVLSTAVERLADDEARIVVAEHVFPFRGE